MTAFVLTRPATTQPLDITTSREIIVPAGQTVNIDALPSSYVSIKWILTLFNETADKRYSAEIMTNHRFGTDPVYQRYAVMGDNINYDMDIFIDTGFLILQVTNNESFDFDVTITQIRTN